MTFKDRLNFFKIRNLLRVLPKNDNGFKIRHEIKMKLIAYLPYDEKERKIVNKLIKMCEVIK